MSVVEQSRDKTRDLFGSLFLPYDYSFLFEIYVREKSKGEDIEQRTLHRCEVPWKFGQFVRRASFDYKYPVVTDPKEANIFVALHRYLDDESAQYQWRQSDGLIYYRNYGAAGSPEGVALGLCLRILIKSNLSKREFQLVEVGFGDQGTVKSTIDPLGKFPIVIKAVRCLEKQNATMMQLKSIKFIARINAVKEMMTPHLGPNKMDISQHLKWSGGYWITFPYDKMLEAVNSQGVVPLLSQTQQRHAREQTLSKTGDAVVDFFHDYMNVKTKRCENSLMGWYPFVNFTRSEMGKGGPYERLFSLLRSYEKRNGNGEALFDFFHDNARRAQQVWLTEPRNSCFYLSYNTYGAIMTRIPASMEAFSNWTSLNLNFQVTETVHQRETNSEEICGQNLRFKSEDVIKWINQISELNLAPEPGSLDALLGEERVRSVVICPEDDPRWYVTFNPVGYKDGNLRAVNVNLTIAESAIINTLKAK